jgi:hypothetical protein
MFEHLNQVAYCIAEPKQGELNLAKIWAVCSFQFASPWPVLAEINIQPFPFSTFYFNLSTFKLLSNIQTLAGRWQNPI